MHLQGHNQFPRSCMGHTYQSLVSVAGPMCCSGGTHGTPELFVCACADERLSWKLRHADPRVPQARRSVRVFVVKSEEKTVVIGLAADSGELSCLPVHERKRPACFGCILSLALLELLPWREGFMVYSQV